MVEKSNLLIVSEEAWITVGHRHKQ